MFPLRARLLPFRRYAASRARQWPRKQDIEEVRRRLREQLFEEGASQHRSSLLTSLSRGQRSDVETTAIVDHLLHERMLFHHKHFTIVISGLAKRGMWERACGMLTDMRELELPPNVICYNAVINVCHKGRAWVAALAVLHEMVEHSAHVDAIGCSSAVAACTAASRWEVGLAAFADFAGFEKDGTGSCSPRAFPPRVDPGNLVIVLAACAQGSQWVSALDILAWFQESNAHPDLVCTNVAMDACGKGRQWQRALSMLATMQAHGPSPDVVSYNTALGACETGSRWDVALHIFHNMAHESVSPNVVCYNAAIHACWRAGSEFWQAALVLFDELRAEKFAPTNRTYGALLASQAVERRWEGALVILEQMQGGHRSTDPQQDRAPVVAPDAAAYGSVIMALCGAPGGTARALSVYREAEAAGIWNPWCRMLRGAMDLHDHSVEVALAAVHMVLADTLASASMHGLPGSADGANGGSVRSPAGRSNRKRHIHDPTRDLVIVTGRGLRSVTGESRLIPALTAFLREEFQPPLELHGHRNPGRWSIPAHSLQRWLRASGAETVQRHPREGSPNS